MHSDQLFFTDSQYPLANDCVFWPMIKNNIVSTCHFFLYTHKFLLFEPSSTCLLLLILFDKILAKSA